MSDSNIENTNNNNALLSNNNTNTNTTTNSSNTYNNNNYFFDAITASPPKPDLVIDKAIINVNNASINSSLKNQILEKQGFVEVNKNDLKDTDNIVIIFGMTTSGKTSFVNLLIGRVVERASLQSGTQDIRAIKTKISNTEIVFVDTPGFGDGVNNRDQKTFDSLKRVPCKAIIYCLPQDARLTEEISSKITEICCCYEMNINNIILCITKCDAINKRIRDNWYNDMKIDIINNIGHVKFYFFGDDDDLINNFKQNILDVKNARTYKQIPCFLATTKLTEYENDIMKKIIRDQKDKNDNLIKNTKKNVVDGIKRDYNKYSYLEKLLFYGQAPKSTHYEELVKDLEGYSEIMLEKIDKELKQNDDKIRAIRTEKIHRLTIKNSVLTINTMDRQKVDEHYTELYKIIDIK